MDEHEVAAMETSLTEEQPEASASGSGAACWGTCEELLLVSAVKRHGVNNWTEISAELKDRAISLNGSPFYFSEETCKHKYDSLRGRFASSSSSSMSRDEDMANGMHWFDELRKLRVAHLKRELEHYDGSIGSLQVKIKRLKAEKAQDTSVNKQLGKSIANSFPNDPEPTTSSHEESVYCIPNEQELVNDHLKYSSLKVCSQHSEVLSALTSDTSIQPCESPGGLLQQVFSEGEQWHDAVEELHEASPITTDITVDTDVLNDHQTIDNCGGDIHLQHEELNEVAPVPIAATVTTDSLMSRSLESQVVESKTLFSLQEDSKDHSQSPDAELVDVQQQGCLVDEAAESLVEDNDAGRDVLLSADDGKRLQQGESLQIKEEVAFEREELLEDVPRRAHPEAEIVKTERSATVISESECVSGMCIDIGIPGFEQSSPMTLVNDSVAIPPLFVSSLPSSHFGNAKEAVNSEREVTLLVDEEAMPDKEGRLALDVDTTEYVTENLPAEDDRSSDKATNLEGGVLPQPRVEIACDIVLEQAAEQGTGQPESLTLVHNESLKETDEHDVRNTAESETNSAEVSPVPEGLDDVTRVTEPANFSSPDRKELPPEALESDNDVPISTVLTGVSTKDMENREAGENSEVASLVCSPSESGGLGISAVVPVADFVKDDCDVLRGGAVFILDKPETKESARSSGLLYLSEGVSLDFKTNSPERQIVIALDEPNNITPLLKSTSVLTDNIGANKISSSIESDMLCRGEDDAGAEGNSPSEPDGDLGNINVTSVARDSLSRGKMRSTSVVEREGLSMDKKAQGDENAMDLLRMMYGSAQETAPESSSVSVEVNLKPEADNLVTASLSSVSALKETSNPGETTSHTPLPAEITAVVAQEPCNFDETPSTKHIYIETDLGQPPQDVVVEETVVDVKTYMSSPENRKSPDTGSQEAEAVDASGTNSEECVRNLECQASLPPKLDSQVFQELNRQHSDNCKDVVDGGVIVVTPPSETPESSHFESEPATVDMQDLKDVGIAPPKNWEEIPEIVLDVKLHIAKEEDLEDPIIQPSILREVEGAKELVGSSLRPLDASQGTAQAISEVELRPTTVNSDTLESVEPNTEAEEMEIDKDVERKEDGPVSAMEREAELSPVEYLPGGAELNRLPSSHEGSDSAHEQSKDGGDNDGEDEERKPGTRDYGESQVDKSEAGSPVDGLDDMSPSSRRNRKEPRVPGKLFPLLEVLRKVCNHKSAYLFKGREEDSRYNLLIRRHLDLTIVRARLEEGSYSGSREFFRDLLLIFNNAMVYYSNGSSEFLGAKSLFAEATKEMERIFQTEALLKQDGPATRTRELKKPKPVVGVATPPKAGQSPLSAGGSSVKSVSPSPTVTNLPDSGCRKRAVSRLGPVETSTTSEALVDLEGGAARSASLNVVGGPSTSRAEEAGDSQDDDEEVNGRLKDAKKLQKGGSLIRGKPQREELLEGILLKNAANKGLGRVKLKDLKEEEVIKKSAVPTKTGAGKLRGERERERKREKEKETETEKGKERDEIDDDDLLRKGKSLAKLKDQDIVRKKEVETKPAPKARASIAARQPSNSYDTLAQSLARPVRGLRKPPSTNKEPTRAPEHQAKKRVKK